VPGQPVGLCNNGNNCWLNAALQLLVHVPNFHYRMQQIPVLAQFVSAYTTAREGCQKVASVDTQGVRQWLSTETRGRICLNPTQEDAAELFEHLFQGQGTLYDFYRTNNGTVTDPRSEPFIKIDLAHHRTSPSTFQNLFAYYFDSYSTDGQHIQLSFFHPPDDILLQFERFYQCPDSPVLKLGKVNDLLDVPEGFTVPQQFVYTRESPSYQCDAFLVHVGQDLSAGHYIAYIKVGNTWWYCSDANVYPISAEDAAEARKKSYIVHFSKRPSIS
jgi:hypothetical protein